MEHHKLLFKAHGSVLSPNPKNCKRKAAHQIRSTKRSELFSSTRNFSPSPPPEENPQICTVQQKENVQPAVEVQQQTEKQSRQKAHLMRFFAWKVKKLEESKLKDQNAKRAPFVVPTKPLVSQADSVQCKKSFAPANHTFNPPANLKDIELKVVGTNSIRCLSNGQDFMFHFVETPKKENKPKLATRRKLHPATEAQAKPKILSASNHIAAPLIVAERAQNPSKKTLPSASVKVPNISNKENQATVARLLSKKPTAKASTKDTPSTAAKPPTSTIKTTQSAKPVAKAIIAKPVQRPQSATTKPSSTLVQPTHKTPSTLTKHTPNSRLYTKSDPQPRSVTKPAPLQQQNPPPPIQQTVKPLPKPARAIMPPPSQQAPKFKTKPKAESGPPKQGVQKPTLSALKRPTFKAPKKSSACVSRALHTISANARSKQPNGAPSIKLNGKSLLDSMAGTIKLAEEPIPETPSDTGAGIPLFNFVTSTKRKSPSIKASAESIFAELSNTVSPVEDYIPTPAREKSKSDKKLDFVRYSIIETEESKKAKEEEPEEKTPERPATPPTTYLSPYVSVSRGKVNTKIEKEKRNSIYTAPASNGTPAAIRHVLATIRYYRKQLTDEITRLNDQCVLWEKYKEANTIEDCAVDMINVTIGQTKLLTSKKLQQFSGLIDRCEDGVLGKANTGVGDGARPILSEDLEGFWSMVGLQIENVDKRFANLRRWEANDWKDPDDVPPKATTTKQTDAKKLKKRKPTAAARPDGALRKMLRNAQAAFRNKKASEGADEDVILTPSKRQVVIKDRRSRSAAATVITVTTPRLSRRSSRSSLNADLNETPKLAGHKGSVRKSMNLLKCTLLNEQEKKSPKVDVASPLRQQPVLPRKSILKTPGSICRRKSVIFDSPALKFTIEDEIDAPETEEKEEEDQRTYRLRNRRVLLRDSSEFVIPK